MMTRYWAVALLALAPTAAGVAQTAAQKGAKEKEIRIQGQLSRDDPKDTKRGTPCKVHLVKLKRGGSYTIDMKSRQFDSYLRLEDPAGTPITEDDDSGGMLDAQIVFDCPKDGEYKVICTCFRQEGAQGNYTLTVKRVVQQVRNTASHGALLGKEAPDFEGDFAVGGAPVKLSSLKGKVVLVEFWDVRSAACVAAFPRLRAWNKAYKDGGLQIVGVTYYPSDIGQRLGFDKGTGKLTDLAKIDRGGERAMLRDFAAYHQLDHLLMALPKEAALKAFDAYVVNGVPQFVVIDRKGIVRAIIVGEGENGVTAVEAELKKLLAAR
jgi:peroxiredoxin